MTPQAARRLDFTSAAQVLADVDHLRRGGWTTTGTWDLAQTLDHLNYFAKACMDGHPYRVPWLLKVLFGRWALRRILSQRRMKSGIPTPQKPLPAPGGDEAAAYERFAATLRRLESHPGPWHDSPFFGHLTPEQWRDLCFIHCAHHLGKLIPRNG